MRGCCGRAALRGARLLIFTRLFTLVYDRRGDGDAVTVHACTLPTGIYRCAVSGLSLNLTLHYGRMLINFLRSIRRRNFLSWCASEIYLQSTINIFTVFVMLCILWYFTIKAKSISNLKMRKKNHWKYLKNLLECTLKCFHCKLRHYNNLPGKKVARARTLFNINTVSINT